MAHTLIVKTDLLKTLQQWYFAQCDSDWEHSCGVHIETLDNPGWLLKVDLSGTALAERPFHSITLEHARDWLDCRRSETQFVAAGGPLMLHELASIFFAWAETPDQSSNNPSCSSNPAAGKFE